VHTPASAGDIDIMGNNDIANAIAILRMLFLS
jgi:hypothetical protein